MATIKLQPSGAVVLKDGKVACSCCEAGGCCMYPAQALFDGLYTADDLPDELLVKIPELFDTIAYKTGSSYFGSNGVEISLVQNSENPELYQWKIDPAGLEVSCLIDVFVEDQFADSYTATSPGAETVTLTRESLCVWRGPEPELYRLRYFDDSATTGFKCKWAFIDSVKDEGQFQNIPTGDYTQPEEENPWVIS